MHDPIGTLPAACRSYKSRLSLVPVPAAPTTGTDWRRIRGRAPQGSDRWATVPLEGADKLSLMARSHHRMTPTACLGPRGQVGIARMRLLSHLLLLSLLSLLPGAGVLLAAPAPVTIGTGVHRVTPTHIEILTGAPEASLEDLASPAFADRWRPLGESRSIRDERQVWLRFAVERSLFVGGSWYLRVRWPVLDEVRLRIWYPDENRWSRPMRAGDAVPVEQRPVASRHLVFPLHLDPGQSAIAYLRVESVEPMVLPLHILDGEALARETEREMALINLFFGGLLVILLYNASLFLFTRDLSYLLYVAYLAAIVGYTLSLTGIGPLYLWEASDETGRRFYGLSAALCFLTANLFARRFLELARHGGWPKHLNTLTLAYWGLLVTVLVVYPKAGHYLGVQAVALLTSLTGLLVPLYLWIRGNRSAALFTLAWASLIVFTVMHLLALDGLLPLNGFTLDSQLLGIFIECVLLSVALAERINRERRERVEAQAAALASSRQLAIERGERLLAQQQALDIQRQANEALESRVRERTLALEQAKRGLEQANAQLARLSITDPLTQLCNRRHFDAALDTELARARQSGQPVALLSIDVDHFKQLNDHYGHPFGDLCLQALATVLQSHAQRQGELAARYGGEEFAVLLPGCDAAGGYRVGERIRRAVTELLPLHEGEPVDLSVSVGVAWSRPNRPLEASSLLASADRALYAAKRDGRNRVAIDDPDAGDPLPTAAVSSL